jgi:hypothetical protein
MNGISQVHPSQSSAFHPEVLSRSGLRAEGAR